MSGHVHAGAGRARAWMAASLARSPSHCRVSASCWLRSALCRRRRPVSHACMSRRHAATEHAAVLRRTSCESSFAICDLADLSVAPLRRCSHVSNHRLYSTPPKAQHTHPGRDRLRRSISSFSTVRSISSSAWRVGRHVSSENTAHFAHDPFASSTHHRLGRDLHLQLRRRLVHQVDRLVRQEAAQRDPTPQLIN